MYQLAQGAQPDPMLAASFRRAKPGLFGSRRKSPSRYLELPQGQDGQPVVPGPISGFGGGTWNLDGSQATAPDGASAMAQPSAHPSQDAGNIGMDNPAPNTGPLGGSMRQPFDYERALEVLKGDQGKPKAWQYALAAVGDALAMNSGYQPYAVQNLTAARNEQAQRQREAAAQVLGWRYNDYARNQEADLRAAAPFSSGRDRVQFDPATGQSRVIHDGAEDFQTYADELGLAPGSEEYSKAVEDFVLRSAGPSAYERDVQLDDHRTGNDAELERIRNGFRVGLEQLRQGNRRGMVDYRNANPAPLRSRSKAGSNSLVTVKTPAEAAKLPKGTRYRGPDGVVRER